MFVDDKMKKEIEKADVNSDELVKYLSELPQEYLEKIKNEKTVDVDTGMENSVVLQGYYMSTMPYFEPRFNGRMFYGALCMEDEITNNEKLQIPISVFGDVKEKFMSRKEPKRGDKFEIKGHLRFADLFQKDMQGVDTKMVILAREFKWLDEKAEPQEKI